MKLFKNKKGSVLVEKILMAAFAVAAGGAVVVYGTNVINNSKNTEITGILSGGEQMSQEELNAHFNDSAKTITLSASELNNKIFPNLSDVVETINMASFSPTSLFYNNKTYSVYDLWFGGGAFDYSFETGNYLQEINFQWGEDCGGSNFMGSYKWNISTYNYSTGERQTESFTENIVWNLGSLYDSFKPALIADLS